MIASNFPLVQRLIQSVYDAIQDHKIVLGQQLKLLNQLKQLLNMEQLNQLKPLLNKE